MSLKAAKRTSLRELHSAVQSMLSRPVKGLRRRPSAYASSYPIEELDLSLARGENLQLILKDLGRASVLANGVQIRPEFLYHPAREIEVYQNWLNPVRHGTPRCHGVINDPQQARHWLLLERVNGLHLWQIGELAAWDDAARWLSRFHREFAGRRRGAKAFLHYDNNYFARWPLRAEKFLQAKESLLPVSMYKSFRRVVNRYDRVVDRLTVLPKTFVHGEFYPSNVIIRPEAGGQPVCAIDWEVAGIGSGLLDLAALTSGQWSLAQKRRFLRAYREEMPAANSSSQAELLELVEMFQLHLCMQMLGWAEDWSPPEQHARNWLREALRLAEKLGV